MTSLVLMAISVTCFAYASYLLLRVYRDLTRIGRDLDRIIATLAPFDVDAEDRSVKGRTLG